MKQDKYYQSFAKRTHVANDLFQQHKRNSICGHHQMVNTEIRLIIFFAVKDGKALYSQHNQEEG